MMNTPPGPTLLGFDVIWSARSWPALPRMAVMFAIYTAVTVRDPMAEARQGAERSARTAQGRHRHHSAASAPASSASNETTDKMKDTLSR
jgi:tight adherence protein C